MERHRERSVYWTAGVIGGMGLQEVRPSGQEVGGGSQVLDGWVGIVDSHVPRRTHCTPQAQRDPDIRRGPCLGSATPFKLLGQHPPGGFVLGHGDCPVVLADIHLFSMGTLVVLHGHQLIDPVG
jgi:hypothetical protein